MPIESLYVEAFIRSVLKNDATLIGATALNGAYIYQDLAKQDAPHPHVTYGLLSPSDAKSVSMDRLLPEYIYQIVAWGKVVNGDLENASQVMAASHRLDELFMKIENRQHTVSNVTRSFNCWRESEALPRVTPGETVEVVYKKYGGFYRFQIFG